jgi:hypothetical protein
MIVALLLSPLMGHSQNVVPVFDSFALGNGIGDVAWGVSGASTSGGYRGQAEWFVPSQSGYFSYITLSTVIYGGSGRSDFYLTEDSGNSTPGNVLEAWPNKLNTPLGVLNLVSTQAPWLEAGVRYWLVDEPADATSRTGWRMSKDYSPGFAFERAPSSWEYSGPTQVPSGAFRVSANVIPEPTGLALWILGASWPVWRAKLRRMSSA